MKARISITYEHLNFVQFVLMNLRECKKGFLSDGVLLTFTLIDAISSEAQIFVKFTFSLSSVLIEYVRTA